MIRRSQELLLVFGAPGLLVLAALDSAGLPLPTGVDLALIILSAGSPKSFLWLAAAATLGSLAGSWFLFRLAQKGGEFYLEKHSLSPRARRFRRWFQTYGLITVFIPALLPIPLPMKLFVLCAGALGTPLRPFLLIVLAARLPRYAALGWLGAEMGTHGFLYLKQYAWHMTAAAAVLFVVLWLLMRHAARRRAAQEQALKA